MHPSQDVLVQNSMRKIFILFILIPINAFAAVCDSSNAGYFLNSGEAQMIEGGFTFGFNGVAGKRLQFKRICLVSSEENVTYEFVAGETTVYSCVSSDCCKDSSLELQINQSINIKADKETAMTWEIEACYLE